MDRFTRYFISSMGLALTTMACVVARALLGTNTPLFLWGILVALLIAANVYEERRTSAGPATKALRKNIRRILREPDRKWKSEMIKGGLGEVRLSFRSPCGALLLTSRHTSEELGYVYYSGHEIPEEICGAVVKMMVERKFQSLTYHAKDARAAEILLGGPK